VFLHAVPKSAEVSLSQASRAEARWLLQSSKQLLAAFPNNPGKHDVRQQDSPWNDCS
jgi:hypothetical protein